MLGNNERFYPGQDDKDWEDEEDEDEDEEQGRETRKWESGRDIQNGGLDGPGEKEMTGGRQTWEGKVGDVAKPAAVAVGRQAADRPGRSGNPGNRGIAYTSNQATLRHQTANKTPHGGAGANQHRHAGLNAAHKRRAPMERSMTSVAPTEETFLTMMVFRIGIPDIKQTVGAECRRQHHGRPWSQVVCYKLLWRMSR